MTDRFVTYVDRCGRCQLDHEGVTFRRFNRPPSGGWTHWATCPETGEPILIRYAPTVVEDVTHEQAR